MTKQSFIFGGDTGLTYDEIKRRRAAMDTQNARNTRPRTIGQGISAIGQALGQNIERGRLDRADKANKERAATRSKKIMQGLVANKYGNGSLSDIMDALNDDYTQPAQKHVFQMLMERKLRPPAPRRTIQGVDGRQYYMDTQEPVLPGVERPAEPTPLMRNYQTAVDGGFEGNIVDYQLALRQPQQRQIIQDAGGFQRDANTGERIFPDAERPAEATPLMKNYREAVEGGFEGNIVDYQLTLRQPQQRQIIKGADGRNYDANTGELILPGVKRYEKPTVAQQNFDYGEENPEFRENQLEMKRAGSNKSTVNVHGDPNDAKLRQKLDEHTGKLWSGFLQQGTVAAASSRDMDLLDVLTDQAWSGPLKGHLTTMFPGAHSASAAFQSIVKRVAPTMRAEGSGSTSDTEYNGMLQALPSLINRPEANKAIVGVMRAKAKMDMARSDIVTRYQTGEMSVADAQRALGDLNRQSIMTPEMQELLQFGNASAGQGEEGGWVTMKNGVRIRPKQN